MKPSLDGRKLTAAARAALEADDTARLRQIRRKPFILHATAATIHTLCDEALEDYPTEGDTHLLVVGDSGMGKSKILKRFAAIHGCPEDGKLTAANVPVLYISCSITASAKGFLGRIFERTNAPYSASASAEVLYPLALRLLRRIGVKLLIVDEVHHVLAGPKDRQLEMLSVLKLLGNDLGITIVASGIDTALRAVQLDPQMARRFDPIALNHWQFGDATAGFLNSIEATLPLQHASDLSEEPLMRWILAESEGLTGDIVRIARRAAVTAIKTNEERITLKTLKSLEWIRPSRRLAESQAALKAGRQVLG